MAARTLPKYKLGPDPEFRRNLAPSPQFGADDAASDPGHSPTRPQSHAVASVRLWCFAEFAWASSWSMRGRRFVQSCANDVRAIAPWHLRVTLGEYRSDPPGRPESPPKS